MTTQRKLSPRRAAEETMKILRSGANEAKAASYQRHFKEPVDFYGLGTESTKQIKRNLLDRVGGIWTIRDAVSFCDAMLRDPHMEARGIGYQVVAHFVPQAQPGLLADVKRWLERSCGNWGLVDNLAPSCRWFRRTRDIGRLLIRSSRVFSTTMRTLCIRRSAGCSERPERRTRAPWRNSF